ncbi:MAG: class I SAM-dependent methyltransferase, partial [Acidobacteriota bacterium]
MKLTKIERRLQGLLSQAGVQLDGDRPCDIRILDRRRFRSALKQGAAAILKAYIDGCWEVQRLDVLTEKLLSKGVGLPDGATLFQVWGQVQRKFVEDKPKSDFFEAMLDQRMVYGSGYWREAETLDEAQQAKLALACRKLDLKPGMRVLDVGCGWGSFCRYAAESCAVSVLGIDLSEEALALARQRCRGLPVDLQQVGVEELQEDDFDAAVAFGVLEYLEVDKYRSFFEALQ